MGSWIVTCESCDIRWPRLGAFSEFEREAIESRPCPCCGAYTLSCPGPNPKPAHGRRTPMVSAAPRPDRAAA